jgi:tRNA-dihydrouridine synthase A
MLAEVDARFFGGERRDLDTAVREYAAHVEKSLAEGMRLAVLVKPMLGLFNGRPGARQFRRHLSENAPRDGAGIAVLHAALAMIRPERAVA